MVVILRALGWLAPALALFGRLAPAAANEIAPLSECGTKICKGMIEGFLNKRDFAEEDLECMVRSIGNATLGVYEAAQNVISLDSQLDGPADNPVAVVLELARSLHGLLRLLHSEMGDCVGGHSQELLSKAAEHMLDLEYVSGRLVANGADIAEEMSLAIAAFKKSDLGRFGRGVGAAGRKLLLSNPPTELLPEGPPGLEELVNATAGIIQGFFGKGFELDITSDKKISTQPKSDSMAFILDGVAVDEDGKEVDLDHEKEKLNVHVDLHACIKRNINSFRATLSKSWLFFAEAAMQALNEQGKTGKRRFLRVMLEGLPPALSRCGIDPKQRVMLADAVEALDHVQLRLKVPEKPEEFSEVTEDLRRGAQHFGELGWFSFGTRLGTAMQGLALQAYPDKYVVTDLGSLKSAEDKVIEVADEAKDTLGDELRKENLPSQQELARGGFESADDLGATSGLSKNGVQIVEGMAEGLLHKDSLSSEESECLMDTVGTALGGAEELAKSLMSVVDEITFGGDILDFEGDVEFKGDDEEMIDELSRSMDAVARISESFMSKCHSEAYSAFMRAVSHLGNIRYMTGRLMVNGEAINKGLDEAYTSYKHTDFKGFGHAIGRVVRLVLLTSKTAKEGLPEGDVTVPQIVNVTAGLLDGFFGRKDSFVVKVKSDKKMQVVPMFDLSALLEDSEDGSAVDEEPPEEKKLDVRIDLYECVHNNLGLYRMVLSNLLEAVATMDVDEALGGNLLTAMMELPDAINRCGITSEQRDMLMQAVDMLDHIQVDVHLPAPNATHGDPKRWVEMLKKCVTEWSHLHWLELGRAMGAILREAVLIFLPQDYKLDHLDAIEDVMGLAAKGPSGSTWQTRLTSLPPAAVFGALALPAALLGARAVRTFWAKPAAQAEGAQDFESGLMALE